MDRQAILFIIFMASGYALAEQLLGNPGIILSGLIGAVCGVIATLVDGLWARIKKKSKKRNTDKKKTGSSFWDL